MRFAELLAASVLLAACAPPAEVPEPPGIELKAELPASPEIETVNPKVVSRFDPDYSNFPSGHVPPGVYVYVLHIDEVGRVQSVREAKSGDPRVDQANIAALRKWRFASATRGGVPVAVDYTITINIHPR